ncbi:hypothetical protein ABIA16_001207 [Sinorhizobium fredii]
MAPNERAHSVRMLRQRSPHGNCGSEIPEGSIGQPRAASAVAPEKSGRMRGNSRAAERLPFAACCDAPGAKQFFHKERRRAPKYPSILPGLPRRMRVFKLCGYSCCCRRNAVVKLPSCRECGARALTIARTTNVASRRARAKHDRHLQLAPSPGFPLGLAGGKQLAGRKLPSGSAIAAGGMCLFMATHGANSLFVSFYRIRFYVSASERESRLAQCLGDEY